MPLLCVELEVNSRTRALFVAFRDDEPTLDVTGRPRARKAAICAVLCVRA